jgi:hypothetical protein
MEESLLPSGSSRRRDSKEERKSSVLGRRVVAITAGDKYQKAAAMVDQVRDEDFRGKIVMLCHLQNHLLAAIEQTNSCVSQSLMCVFLCPMSCS